ncbi:MAG TPA: DUF2334 domain-containing protein, partial [Candidatus Andersenbacteria bacterium]|nr:DUF2334 domain-containing protein [Candidatus Andersenbacteria bacterium]
LNTSFWDFVKTKALDGWIIAQHGYQHLYLKHKKTEFAGLPYHEQYKKIQLGQEILKEKLGFAPVWWMAPAHSFDKATCNALKDLGFEYITDGIALYPYKKYGLTWIPQQLWRPRAMPFGTWTICLHTNTMTAQGIQDMIEFMKKNKAQFQDVSLQPKKSLCNIAFKIIWGTMYISRRL